MTEKKVAVAKVGSMWDVPEGSVVTTPSGASHKVTGGRFALQESGTYTNDTGDAVTVRG